MKTVNNLKYQAYVVLIGVAMSLGWVGLAASQDRSTPVTIVNDVSQPVPVQQQPRPGRGV